MPFINLEALLISEPIPGFKGRFVHSENMTVANWAIEAGSSAPQHNHPNEQITFVLQGEFELTLSGETRILTPGIAAIIPAGESHSGIALTDCYLIDVFYPVRDDYQFD